MKADIEPSGDGLRLGAQVGRIAIDHVGEAPVGRLADQGVHAGIVDVVADEHQIARTEALVDRAGGIGQQQGLCAEVRHRFKRRTHGSGIAVFVVVLTPGEHYYALAAEGADQQIAAMARNAATGKALEFGIGDGHAVCEKIANA